MGTRRDEQKSGKAALPKQSSSTKFSGFSFKALEEEEEDNEEDLTLFTGKFDKVVEEKHRNRSSSTSSNTERPSLASSPDSKLSKLHHSSKSLDEDRSSSPSRKNKASVFEYKEIITGIKEKITDTKEKITESINKKLEELSNDASPTTEQSKLADVIDHPLSTDVEDEEKPEICERVNSAPAALSELVATDADDEIEVIESYFGEEPFESFDGEYGVLNGKSSARSRKMKGLASKTSASVSMSNLITTPERELDVHKELDTTPSGKDEVTSEGSSSVSSDIQSQSHDSIIPWQKIASFSVLVFAIFLIPLPSFLSGLLIGSMLASGGWCVFIWLTEKPTPKPIVEAPPLDKAPPMKIPRMKEPTKEKGIYKGWMNELLEYNPDDYHINKTHSVFVVLEGTNLRLQRPKTNMPKRAMWNEVLPAPHFIHQRHLQIKDSRVYLMPPGLVDKRLWSKKYPICIALAPDAKGSSKKLEDSSKKTSDDESSDFEIVTEEKCSNRIVYLFARTCPEKEEWYKRFKAAASGCPQGNHIIDIYKAMSFTNKIKRKSSDSAIKHRRQSSTDSSSSVTSLPESPSPSPSPTDPTLNKPDNLQMFAEYMGRLMPSHKDLYRDSASAKESLFSSPRPKHYKIDHTDLRQLSGSLVCDAQLVWLNSLVGRCFWDFLRDEWWAEKVREKLQKKLSKIHVPYFIEELKVTHIDLGFEMPVVRRAGMPYIDERGFWVDLDVVYNGGFKMSIETKLNLMKLRKVSTSSEVDPSSRTSPVTDPNEEDSAESSTDDEEESQLPTGNDSSSSSGSKKLMKVIDKIAQSRYFQQAYEYKYIKKAMEGVSNTPLELSVEVKSLNGILAINIPPPATDRLWYGFRTNPSLSLSAKPKVGEREVNISHVTDWIEKKLSTEFQRVFVMPNMDDLSIPILIADIPSDTVPSSSQSTTGSAV